MISREMIISYLTEYSAIEEIFRTYYEQDGKVNSFYDMEKKYAFFMKEGSRFLQRKKELDEKYPKKILDLDNVDLDAWEKENVQKNMDHEIKEKNRVHFLHKEFFETDKNIFINKHIRFSPGEFHDHEFIEMCYIYRGKVDQFLRSKEGKAEKKETLNQGNLLIIPPIALIYYFRKYPRVTKWGVVKSLLVSAAVLTNTLLRRHFWGIFRNRVFCISFSVRYFFCRNPMHMLFFQVEMMKY